MNNLAVNIGDAFGSPFKETSQIGGLVSLIVRLAFSIAGILIVFFFIFGGISMIASAGKGDAESAAKGKQAITAAVIGFAIVFVAYWIVKLIEIWTGLSLLG